MFMKLIPDQIQTKLQFISNYLKSKNAADGSKLDANANVESKNVATLAVELNKDVFIQLKRAMMVQKLNKHFDFSVSSNYLSDLSSHDIYVHDETSAPGVPYCVSISLYPFLLNGTKDLNGISNAPKHLDSFCGSFINLVFAISSQFAGALATSEFLLAFNHFAEKDYGENYLETHSEIIKNRLQEVVYCINQPATARGFQAIFYNVSIFDKAFYDGMFGHFVFPDGTKPNYTNFKKLQKFFLTWFRKEREKVLLTFPVVTVCMKTNKSGTAPEDTEFADFIAEEMSLGNSFFLYQAENVNSLASCCFMGNQMTLSKSSSGVNYMSFEDLYNSKYGDTKRNFTVFHNGSWVKGKIIKVHRDNKKLYEITTVNGKTINITEDHINPTLRGDILGKDLTTEDYLLFNCNKLDSFPEKNMNLKLFEGVLIGAYLGDGSCEVNEELSEEAQTKYVIALSLNETKYRILLPSLKQVCKKIHGSEECLKLHTPYNNVYPVRINSKKIYDFIKYWVKGNYAVEKQLNLDCLLQSSSFREGIYKGYYATDGGNSNRIYTTSEKLVHQMEALFSSLGIVTIIDVSDRTDEKVIIRDKEFNRNHKLYCIRWYESGNKRTMKDVYIVRNNSTYFKIKSIKEINSDDLEVYCFEIENKDEPYFTLPNGIITHNCRLRNEMENNEFSSTLGCLGVMTGSVHVITMNMNRIIQYNHKQYVKERMEMPFIEYLKIQIVKKIQNIHKYHIVFRSILKEFLEAKMLPAYSAGFIDLSKQFSTIGINGMVEGCEFLGMNPGNNEEFMSFVADILSTISDENKKASKIYGVKFNTEFVPAENLGYKNALNDNIDGYFVPRAVYNSYFYPVESNDVTVLDKFILHGHKLTQYLDGGSALHLNLAEHLSKTQYLKLFEIACKTGCSYWCVNVRMTICNSCNHIDYKTYEKCPKCSSENIDWATRIIGYLKRISSFSTPRQKEASVRIYHRKEA